MLSKIMEIYSVLLMFSAFALRTGISSALSTTPDWLQREDAAVTPAGDLSDRFIEAVINDDFGEVLRLVQEDSAMANAADTEATALIYAIREQNTRMVRLLLQYGADANAYVERPLASPPSFWAVDGNNTEILELLLEYCANPKVRRLYVSEADEAENITLLEATKNMSNPKMTELVNEYLQHGCGRCPAEKRPFSLLNINWWLPETASRNVANISCPVRYGSSFGTWRCGTNSTWEEAPDLTPCQNLHNLFVQPSEEGTPTTAAENLTTIAHNLNSITLLPGDILAIDRVVKTLQSQHINHDLLAFEPEAPSLTKQYLTALVNVTGKMLEQPTMWGAMPKEKATSVVTDMQENVLQGAMTAAQYLKNNSTDDYPNKNLHVRVAHQPMAYYIANENRLYKHLVFPETHLQLPEGFYQNHKSINRTRDQESPENSDLITVIFSSYSDLHCISNAIPCNPPIVNDSVVKAKEQVNSGVIGANVGYGRDWHAENDEVVKVKFKHIYDGAIYVLENPECVWWDNENKSWSSYGCYLYDFTASYTLCHCNHLTNLAVIMDINGLLDKNTVLYKTLEWFTIIGCSLSIISLAICVTCFLFLKKVRMKKSSSIRANLCICLLLAELVLLMGLNATKRALICKSVAALLQYFFLATFTWSAIEAFNLYLVLIKVFETRTSMLKHYMLIGYGVPLLVVGVTMAVTKAEGYGTKDMCWLAPNNLIWSFAGSLVFIMLTNLISFVMTMQVAWRGRPSDRGKASSNQVTKRISGSIAIFLMLGLTWVTGFFYMAEDTKMLALLFTVLNSLQGFGIFVFGVLLDDTIRKEAKDTIEYKMDSKKVPSSLKGSINPQRRGSYTFNTDADESTRADTMKVTTGEVSFGCHRDSMERKTKL